MARTAYIHIPFCAHKCDFCDFAAFAGVDDLSQEYTRVVINEIAERVLQQPNDGELTSVHYGGGTPGYIDPEYLLDIHKAVRGAIGLTPDAEVALETTPHAISLEKAKRWKEIGINRLSIGVQSFNDNELKAMGRDHTATQALKGIEIAQEAGFDNIGLDLMYGLPEQTVSTWGQTLSTALSLRLPHLSAYGLTLAGNSPLLVRYPHESESYPSEDIYVSMYEALVSMAPATGLHQYEISNFCQPGFQSRHNLTYWTNDEYLAFGVSAHRYVNGVRSSNFRSLKRYMRDYLGNETFEEIDEKTKAKEAIFLGLRLREGINVAEFRLRYGFDIEQLFQEKIEKLSAGGFLTVENGHLRLSQSGVLVSNLVIAEFV